MSLKNVAVHVLLAAMLLVGCGTKPAHMYAGPPQHESQVATIWTSLPFLRGPNIKFRPDAPNFGGFLVVQEVDGIATKKTMGADPPYVVYVLPGSRTLKVGYGALAQQTGWAWSATGTIEARVEAGKTYVVDAKPDFANKNMNFYLRLAHPTEL